MSGEPVPAEGDGEGRPEPLLVHWLERLRPAGPALDLACGRGRHALLLARRGIPTEAVDRDPGRIAGLAARAAAEGLPLTARVADLEAGDASLPVAAFGLVVVVHYLHRPLCPAIAAALRPGGVLFYQTFTTLQPRHGRPRNPAFLLASGELRALFPGLEVVASEEGERIHPETGALSDQATLVARRPGP